MVKAVQLKVAISSYIFNKCTVVSLALSVSTL